MTAEEAQIYINFFQENVNIESPLDTMERLGKRVEKLEIDEDSNKDRISKVVKTISDFNEGRKARTRRTKRSKRNPDYSELTKKELDETPYVEMMTAE